MKRTIFTIALLTAIFALTPLSHAAENPITAARGCTQPIAAAQATLGAPAGSFSAWLKAGSSVQAQDKINGWEPTPQNTPCFKCFSLGVDCCTRPGGGTFCCD
jgi:hypothetical protein